MTDCSGRLVLQNIPMCCELAVHEADDIGGDPGGGTAVAGEATVRDDIVALGHDQLVLIAQRLRQRPDQVKQTLAAWCDVGAMLDVAVGPKSFGAHEVALVEEHIERQCYWCGPTSSARRDRNSLRVGEVSVVRLPSSTTATKIAQVPQLHGRSMPERYALSLQSLFQARHTSLVSLPMLVRRSIAKPLLIQVLGAYSRLAGVVQ
jgi:hypothetical protein